MKGDSPKWKFEVARTGTIHFHGQIDYTVTPQVRIKFLDHIGRTTGSVHVDLWSLEYMDSSGLAIFIEMRKRLKDTGRSLRIDAASPEVKRIFKISQVDTLFFADS